MEFHQFYTVLSRMFRTERGDSLLVLSGVGKKPVRKVRTVHIVENNTFLRVLPPPYRIIVGFETVMRGKYSTFLRIKLIIRRRFPWVRAISPKDELKRDYSSVRREYHSSDGISTLLLVLLGFPHLSVRNIQHFLVKTGRNGENPLPLSYWFLPVFPSFSTFCSFLIQQ